MPDSVLTPYSAILLDMNNTFLFGEDRFGSEHDYAATCRRLGGRLPAERVRSVIDACYRYLAALYPDPECHDRFPTIADTLRDLPEAAGLSDTELRVLEQSFADHELGRVPQEYAAVVRKLATTHRLALVADIWSQKQPWLDELERVGLLDVFEVLVFSSDLGSVKPSPRPFRVAVAALGVDPAECVVIGDSARRDVGGAHAAGLDAICIGRGKAPAGVVGVVGDLFDLGNAAP